MSRNFENILKERGGKNRLYHPYHLVDNSPWPLQSSIAILFFAINIVEMLVSNNMNNLYYCTFQLVTVICFWWRDVIREGIGGFHTRRVQTGIQIGFLLFLISEIMIFFSLFWCFFHSSLAPAIEQGSVWPPIGIRALNPWAIPLQGTCILLGSGFIQTEAHHATILGNKKKTLYQVFNTILLGLIFLCLQGLEYYWGEFTIADSVFGSIFYCTTSQHGLHVLIGVLFIITSFIRIYFDYITTTHHQNYEFAIYYWHLVDIIWIIVFILYYYGSY